MVGDELTGFEECADGRVPAHRKFHGQRKEELPATVTPGKDVFFSVLGFFVALLPHFFWSKFNGTAQFRKCQQ